MQRKRIMIIIVLTVVCMFIKINEVQAYEIKSGIESFPESFKPYLQELKNTHTNWNFYSLYTGLSWNDVINEENVFGKNLVPKSYSDRWKNTKPGEYNIEIDGDWVDSSRQAVEYTMDPRNFLNEVRIFQFENLSSNVNYNTRNSVEKILYGTEFYNTQVNYLDESGNRIFTDKCYSDLIVDAAQDSLVSAFHLASRIKQEVGPFLSHKSISGDVDGYRGLYNFYNIGATSSVGKLEAIKKGLQYARDGKGASLEIRNRYLIPWNTKARSVTGGAIFIGSSYINRGQNTIYLQKFHVVDNTGSSLFWHQYMTNVLAAYSESKTTYNGYANNNLLNDNINFIIPVYDNMPQIMAESPSVNPSDYLADNTKVIANVSTSLNIRSGPGTNYESVIKVPSGTKMTRISKGIGAGELWDRVILENGIIGYVFDYYLQEEPEIKISKINLSLDNNVINKNERIKVKVEILPIEARDQKVIFSSQNTKIALVDDTGNILAVSKGKTKINVRSEDGSISSNIDIEVYSKVENLELYKDKKILQIGNDYKVEYTVYPNDANNKQVNYKSTNTDIALVDESGIVTAINEGECEIIVTTKDSNVSKSIDIKVIKPLTKEEIDFNESLRVNTDEISGINENYSVKELKDKILTKYYIQVENCNGEILDDEKTVGTGSKIKIIDDKGQVIMEYEIIIYGDVDGDGKITSIDLLLIQRHILELDMLKGVFYKAGNIYKDGKSPSSFDLLLIQRHILELKLIEQ